MTTIAAAKTRFTPDDLLHLPDAEKYELVDGELRERNVSIESSRVAARMITLLGSEADSTKSATVYGSDLGYQCFADAPDKIRKPDASVIRSDRLAAVPPDAGYMPLAPDLAVEVVSPNDLANDVAGKVQEYLAANVQLVWVVHPKFRTVSVFRVDGSTAVLRGEEVIDGEIALPTFRRRISEFF